MGRWFARFLLAAGNEVVITGRSEDKLRDLKTQLDVTVSTDLAVIKSADAVMISVPIESFEDVVKQLQSHIQPQQVVIDITSIKALPVAMMHRHLKAKLILGVHPLFGPGARDIVKQNFVLTPINQPETELAEKISQYLIARGARVVLMSPQEHDEMMTVILGLAHFIAIVAADTLLSFGRFPETEAVSGTTYKVLLTLIESVISEDPELYASLQMNLPGLTQIEETFVRNSQTWAQMVKNGNRQGFVNRMSNLKESLEKNDPNFKQAYQNMYRLLEQ